MKDVIGTLVRDLSRRAGFETGFGPQVAFAAAGLVGIVWFVALQPMMPADTLAPFFATLCFLLACLALHLAFREGASALSARLTYWDVSGFLTFAGICVAALIEPEGLVRLVTADDRPE